MKERILFSTNNHLGDVVICTSVIFNLKKEFPQLEVGFETNYKDVFKNNPFVDFFEDDGNCKKIKLQYVPFSQKIGNGGLLTDAFNVNCMRILNKKFPIVKNVFDVYLTDEEKENKYGDYWIINANCQTCSETKAYPWYQEIVNARKNIQFIQIGGKEQRDIQQELTGVIDLRQKTSIRELISLVSNAKGIISPPSAITHIASAFDNVKNIVLSGAREPQILTKYKNTKHFFSECEGYNKNNGCMKFFMREIDERTCKHVFEYRNQKFPRCMMQLKVSEIIKQI